MRNQYDHELKLERALQYLETLKIEVQRWLGGNPYSIIIKLDPERGENSIGVNALRHPPSEFSLIIGDCLHNFRSALDSIVRALAITELNIPLPPEVEKRVQFPITENSRGFKDSKWRIRDISQEAQAEIEWLQPYNRRPDDFTKSPLWVLNELSNIDKHRLPHLTLFAVGEMPFRGTGRFKGGRQWEAAAVEDRTELLGIDALRDDLSGKVDVEFYIKGSIAFAGPIAQGADVFEILRGIRDEIMNEVLPRLRPFFPPLPLH